MRELHECQAEVFRRSEKRIKERKQRRNHILMACIPLVLCITLFGALLLPGMEPTGSTGELLQENFSEQHAGGLGTEAVGGLFTDSVEVSGNGVSSYYTSAEDVQGIITLLNSIVSIPESDDGYGDRDLSEGSSGIKENPSEDGYTITVKLSDGTNQEYLLKGNLLIDQVAKKTFLMSTDACRELKDTLGIPQD